jgi:glycosyltransferase involved in cell wall biosynthesis
MLAQTLVKAGHSVRWFNSDFDHYHKRWREQGAGSFEIHPKMTMELMSGIGYDKNTSPRRILHNHVCARRARQRAHEVVAKTGRRPDIMVMDMPMPEMAHAGVMLAREWGIPSVLSIRDLWPDFFTKFLSPFNALLAAPAISLMDWQIRRACREATSIVGISQGYLDWALKKADRSAGENDVVFPLGYSPVFDPGRQDDPIASLEAKGIDPSKKLVTFVGSWGKTYDLDFLLEVASRLKAHKDIQVVIAGGGEQQDIINQKAKEFTNVILPGWLSSQEIADLLQETSVAVAPYGESAPQGMPNKLFEYMSAGLYQVTTLQGEAADLLRSQNLGKAVSLRDPEAFADAVYDGIQSMSAADERARIKEYFDLNFHASVIYEDYTKHLESLVARISTGSSNRASK